MSILNRVAIACTLTIVACAKQVTPDGMPAAQPMALLSSQDAYKVVTVVEGLLNPWSMAFLPNGDMLVTERPGRLRMVRNGVLQPDSIAGVPAVRARGQGGLLEVALHPNFASNRFVYLTYSKVGVDTAQGTTAVVRGRLQGNALTDVKEIFEAKAWSRSNGHFGSRIQFDRNGFMFITVGDRQASPTGATAGRNHPAQSLMVHQGKVLRLHDDGRVPADNPFVGRTDALPEIWSYGHRNPQGLAIHPQTGDIWSTEHAARGGDELNLVQKGRNYGWPVIGMGINYDGGVIHEGTSAPGMEEPIHHYIPSIGTSGLLVYTGNRFPQWRGNIFVGGLVGQQIVRLTMDGRRVASHEKIFEQKGRVRDIRQGPDGLIYIALDTRTGPSIVRLEPAR